MARNKSKPLFVDTGFIIALINENDHYHRQALALSEKYLLRLWITCNYRLHWHLTGTLYKQGFN